MKVAQSISDIKAVPFFSQFTEEQIKKQVKANAEGLRKMEARAIEKGKKVGGFTADQLAEMASRYEKML
jgi:hypothetical protein